PNSLSIELTSHSPPRSILYVTVPFDSTPPPFMVTSQVPASFLRISCSGPGLGGSWARAAGTTSSARATAHDPRTAFIDALREDGRPLEGTTPRTAPDGLGLGEGCTPPAAGVLAR